MHERMLVTTISSARRDTCPTHGAFGGVPAQEGGASHCAAAARAVPLRMLHCWVQVCMWRVWRRGGGAPRQVRAKWVACAPAPSLVPLTEITRRASVARCAPVHSAGSQLPLRVLGMYLCRANGQN